MNSREETPGITRISAEKVQGEWLIKTSGTTHYHYCSICGNAGDFWETVCKYCGAEMHYDLKS